MERMEEMKRQKAPQNKTRTPLASGGSSKRRSKTRGDNNYTSQLLRPGWGRASPIYCALAVKDATTNDTTKTQEPGAQ